MLSIMQDVLNNTNKTPAEKNLELSVNEYAKFCCKRYSPVLPFLTSLSTKDQKKGQKKNLLNRRPHARRFE